MESKLGWAQFFAKYLTIIVAGVWALIAGTDLILKESASIELRNKKLGIESIPLAKSSMTYSFDNPPWFGEEDICTVTGSYKIANVGSLPIVITSISFDVYENKALSSSDIGNSNIESFTLSSTMNNLEPIFPETFPEYSKIDAGQFISRSFGYIIRRKPGHLYLIEANAEGGLASASGGVDNENTFNAKELRFNSGFKTICGGDTTMP